MPRRRAWKSRAEFAWMEISVNIDATALQKAGVNNNATKMGGSRK